MNNRQLVAIAGAGVMFLGVFAPIVSLPIVGSMNYFQNGKGDGSVVLALSVASAVLAMVGQFRGLWLTGGGALAVMGFTFINFHRKLSELKASMGADLAGNPFRGLAEMAAQSVQLQWGWALLVLGALLVLVSAGMKGAKALATSCPHCGGVLPIEQPRCNHCGNAVTWVQGVARKPSRPVA